MSLEFRKADHTYWVEGKQVRGVSRILEASGLKEKFFGHGNGALVLGSAVHELTEHMDRGIADRYDYSAKVLTYKPGWENFRRLKPFEVQQIEVPIYSPQFDFAGTPDRVVLFQGQKKSDLLEIKTGNPYAWHPFQTSGYRLLTGTRRRFIVYLSPDYPLGFTLKEHTGATDEQKFRAALITTQGMNLEEGRTA